MEVAPRETQDPVRFGFAPAEWKPYDWRDASGRQELVGDLKRRSMTMQNLLSANEKTPEQSGHTGKAVVSCSQTDVSTRGGHCFASALCRRNAISHHLMAFVPQKILMVGSLF